MKRLADFTVFACISVSALASCKDDAENDGDDGSDSSSETTTTTTVSTSMTSSSTTDNPTSPGCIDGNENCPCLGGECVGNLECVEDLCKPGATFDPEDDDRSVLGGLVVPVVVNVVADEFSWSQVAGPTVVWQGDGTSIQVPVPADAAVGEVITMRITAIRNTIESTFDYSITVLEPVFEDFLVLVDDPEQLGTSVGLDFDDNGNMWVSSSEGFISRFAIDGSFQSRYDLAGAAGIRWGTLYLPDSDDNIDVLYAAQSSPGAVSAYNPNNDAFSTITDALEDLTALGAVDVVLPSDGDLYLVDPGGSRLLRYTDDDLTSRVLTTEVTGPAVLSFGPDANVLYVGAVGQVWRVGLLQDGLTATPELYVEFGDPADPTQEVGGLEFDEGGNLWIGVPGAGTVHIAPYAGAGASATVRSFSDVGPGISSFAQLQHGNGDFSDSAMYWTNLSDRTVARIETGLRGL